LVNVPPEHTRTQQFDADATRLPTVIHSEIVIVPPITSQAANEELHPTVILFPLAVAESATTKRLVIAFSGVLALPPMTI
jgi:hypothetical protein